MLSSREASLLRGVFERRGSGAVHASNRGEQMNQSKCSCSLLLESPVDKVSLGFLEELEQLWILDANGAVVPNH